jgi:hypothetical protein
MHIAQRRVVRYQMLENLNYIDFEHIGCNLLNQVQEHVTVIKETKKVTRSLKSVDDFYTVNLRLIGQGVYNFLLRITYEPNILEQSYKGKHAYWKQFFFELL